MSNPPNNPPDDNTDEIEDQLHAALDFILPPGRNPLADWMVRPRMLGEIPRMAQAIQRTKHYLASDEDDDEPEQPQPEPA